MQNSFFQQKFSKLLLPFLLAAMLAVLAGCSPGIETGTDTPPSTVGVVSATTIQLLVTSQQIQTSTIASTTLTAVVVDASGQAVDDKVVIFSQGGDSTAYFSDVSAITINGIAKATLNIGSDRTNRVISVTATADAAVGANTVTMSGTRITISGNTSMSLNALSTLTIIVKDSTGVPVPGVTLAVTSANGNPIVFSPLTRITDPNGQLTATVTANNAGTGTDVLTINGAGATQTQTLIINSASFAITAPVTVSPATTPEIVVNTPTPVSVTWTNALTPVVGQTVSFYTSRGTFTPTTAVTNGSGIATANLSAASTGVTIITASGPGGTPAATLNAVLVTTTATSITAQASPSTLAINSGGSIANQAVIAVVVRDANSNLVKNAQISFSQVTDASGGSLTAGQAITDITGTASINYIAGSTSSPQNGVEIAATVHSINGTAIAPLSTSVFLTVASQSMFVRLGTDNKVYPDIPVIGSITKQYIALITDTALNPVPDGTQVRFILRPAPLGTNSFAKGFYSFEGAWIQTVTVECPNEDINGNFQLDASEDTNGNLRLDPLGVATVNATATTASGFAIAKISYSKDHAHWVRMVLEARAGTVGSDPPATVLFVLTGASADYADEFVAPPGVISPFGTSSSCGDTE